MSRKNLTRLLEELEDGLLSMGRLVEEALVGSVRTLESQDRETAAQLIADDAKVNDKRYEIEARAIALIATQQPMATDLRTVATVLEISTELERIGDYAKGIARISQMIDRQVLPQIPAELADIAGRAQEMLRQALDAFVRRDVALARAIPAQDLIVDQLYNQVYRELMAAVIADPARMEAASALLWAAHNLERTADRVTNICERVVFTVTGVMIEMDSDSGLESLG